MKEDKVIVPVSLMNQIVTILQELPAKNVYNIIKAIEGLQKEKTEE